MEIENKGLSDDLGDDLIVRRQSAKHSAMPRILIVVLVSLFVLAGYSRIVPAPTIQAQKEVSPASGNQQVLSKPATNNPCISCPSQAGPEQPDREMVSKGAAVKNNGGFTKIEKQALKTASNNNRNLRQNKTKPTRVTSGCLESTDPGPADCDTFLKVDETDPTPIGNRTPLILIHGIHGNQLEDGTDSIARLNRNYFAKFLNYFNYSSFQANYKIYRFHYVSDKYPVWEIARSLRNYLDAFIKADPTGFDKPFVIIAHSMGGLIARSYMEQHSHNEGNHRGKKGGERVLQLITLATPHHGTPGSNGTARAIANRSLVYNWNFGFTLLDAGYWWLSNHCFTCALFVSQPNRSDMRWDNFNGILEYAYRENLTSPPFDVDVSAVESNNWLRAIPHAYDHKIVTYWGYIGDGRTLDNADRDLLMSFGRMAPVDLFLEIIEHRSAEQRHNALSGTGVLLQRIYDKNFGTLNVTYLRNDGVVPTQSAAFDGYSVRKQVECPGHDHLHMQEGASTPCKTGHTLFRSLVDDLGIAPPLRALEVSPDSSLSFGNAVASNSVRRTLTLSNSGNATITVTNGIISGRDSGDFTFISLPSMPFNLAPSQQVTVTIQFRPGLTGTKIGTVSFSNNSDNSPEKTINLSGIGVQAGCNYSLSSSVRSFGSAGGNNSFTVTAGSSCNWTVSSNAAWITVTSGNNGTGTQMVSYTVAPNSAASLRTGTITILGGNTTLTFTVSEDGASSVCSYFLSSNFRSFGTGGGNDNFIITAPTNCTWSASSDSPWLTITSNSNGTGTQAVTYSVTANPATSTRYGTIRVQGQSTVLIYTVSESGRANTCSYSLPDFERSYSSSGQQDTLLLTASSGCSWRASGSDGWVSILSSNNGAGTQVISYFVGGNPTPNLRLATITVQGENTTLNLTVRQAGQPVVFPDINLLATSFSMADALINSTTYQSVLVQNLGSAPLYIGAISRSSGSADFSVFASPQTIDTGGTGSVTMQFSPSSLGPKSAVFSISSNDPDEGSVSFTVSGNGVNQTTGGIDFVWVNKSITPDSNRISSAVAVVGNNIYVLGGNLFRTNYKYDPTINSWMPIADSPHGVSNGGAAVINGKIYAVHNILGPDVVQIYDPGSGSWTTGAGMLNPRRGLAVASVNGKLYALGGIVDSGKGDHGVHDIEEYDPVGNIWVRKADMPTARGYAAAVVINNLIYVIGGMTISGVPIGTVEVYDPATDTWSSRQNMPTPRFQPAAVALGNKIHVIGGVSPTGPTNKVEELDTSLPGPGNMWFTRNAISFARYAAVAGVVNNKIYVIGGASNSGAVTTVEEGSLNASPQMNVPVRVVSFGDVPVNRIGEKNLEIQNLGNANLTLDYTLIAGTNEFTLFAAPFNLEPGQSATMKFRLTPNSLGDKSATFQITSNDPHAPALNLSFSGNGISVLPPSGGTWQIVNTIPLTGTSNAQFIGIGNGRAYVGRTNASLTAVDLGSGAVLADIPFAAFSMSQPAYIAVSGNRAYVSLAGLVPEGELAVIDTESNSVLTYIPVGYQPSGVAAGNNKVYVSNDTNFTDGTLSSVRVLDPTNNSIIATIPVGRGAAHVAVDPATGRTYVANRGYNCAPLSSCPFRSVSVIDGSSNAVIRTVLMPSSPNGVAISGSRAYVCTGSSVEVLDISSNGIIASIPVEQFSQGIAAAADYVFVANRLLNLVYVISVATNSVVAIVNVHDPSGIAVDTTTNNVYVVNGIDRTISVIRFVAPRFTISCDQQSLAISQGGNATINCTVIPIDGFSDPVDLSVESLPTGSESRFSNSSLQLGSKAPATTTLTINIPANVVSGTYGFKVVGTSEVLTDSVNMSLTVPTCFSPVSSQSQFFPVRGGSGRVIVSGLSTCGWTATASEGWIVIVSSDNGTGNATVDFEVRENFTQSARSAVLNVGGQAFTIVQDGGLGNNCQYSISPQFESFSANGGTGNIQVSADERCAWQATSSASWIIITSNTLGIGSGTITYSVAPNPGSDGRKGAITIAGKTFSVKQKSSE